MAPVWYEFERDRRAFLVVGRERAQWIDHIRGNPRMAFHVADDLHAHHTREASRVRQTAADLEAMGREGRLKDVSAEVDRLQGELAELSTFLGSAPWRQ